MLRKSWSRGRLTAPPFCRLMAAVLVCVAWTSATGAADTSGRPSKTMLLLDLRDGAYQSLDAELLRWQEAFEQDSGAEAGTEAAFLAFSSSDPTLEKPLQEWATGQARSFAALTARGVYYRHLAELSRGDEPFAATAPQRFAEMERYDLLATADLEAAIALRPKALVAHALLVAIAVELRDIALLERRTEQAVAALGPTAAVCAAYMGRFDARRGGTMPELEAFIGTQAYSRLCGFSASAGRYFAEMVAGEAAEARKEIIAAIDHYSAAAQLGGDRAARLARGLIFLRGAWHAGALAEFDRLVAADPDDDEALFRRGLAKWHSHRPDDALDDFDSAVALDPLNPRFLVQRADVLLEQQRTGEAAADLKNALRFGEYDEAVQESRARMFMTGMPDPRRAASAYERLVQLAPQNSRHWMGYAVALLQLRDCKAIEAAAEFRRLCPEQQSCQVMLDDGFYSDSLEQLRAEQNCPAGR